MTGTRPRLIAFYLPQYHPIPENDRWWGKGFTEWTSTVKCRPRFKGHYQPHLPADLGFYDLRLPEARQAQADLAKQYGITGFCYYHYWFHGRRILDRPLNEVLIRGEPEFPFCICWANENWRRPSPDEPLEILIRQTYSPSDDLEHIRALIPLLQDKRYIRIEGKPVVLIYRSTELPDSRRTIDTWREEAARNGLDLYLCRVEGPQAGPKELLAGFDAAVEFAPILKRYRRGTSPRSLAAKLRNRLGLVPRVNLNSHCRTPSGDVIINYEYLVNHMTSFRGFYDYRIFPGVLPNWDNSPRFEAKAWILHDSRPELYYTWLRKTIEEFEPYSAQEDLLFITAWNEWAEGNHLEPDQKWGLQYLEATRKAIDDGCRVAPIDAASRDRQD